jgi:chromosome segregation ATPase
VSKRDKVIQRSGPRDARERGLGDLTEAALALEQELDRFEELAATARRLPLDTRRSLERAAKATTEAAGGQDRVNATLGALVAAITAARERHEANALALQTRGEEIRVRAEEVSELYERFSALGDEGKLVNQLVQEAAATQRTASTPAQVRALVADIESIEERMSKLVEVARALNQAAAAATVTDVAEQTDALKQQVAAARNKLGLLRKGLVAQLADASKLN